MADGVFNELKLLPNIGWSGDSMEAKLGGVWAVQGVEFSKNPNFIPGNNDPWEEFFNGFWIISGLNR